MNVVASAREHARILLVDGYDDVRALLRRLLVQAGHDGVEAGSGTLQRH